MEITCDNCQSKFKIPDNKIPPGKTASFLCRKCKHKITVSSSQVPDSSGFDLTGESTSVSGFDSAEDEFADVYESDETPFDFAEEEGLTALICVSDEKLTQKKIKPVLEFMEYHVSEVDSTRNAIKKMRYHSYDLIVVDEEFDTKHPDANGILIYLSRLNSDIRRNIYAILLTQRFRTMDFMRTLNKSVNLIVNIKDIEEFDKILGRGKSDSDMFYRVFKESLKNTGRV